MEEFLQFEDGMWSADWPFRVRFQILKEGGEPKRGFIYFRKYRPDDVSAALRDLLETAGENCVVVRLEKLYQV